MSDINKLVENYFQSSNNNLKASSFLKLIEEVIEEKNKNTSNTFLKEAEKEKSAKKSILDFLPPIQITEDWGVIGTEARSIFEKYMNNIQGAGLPDKIAWINNFMGGAGKEKLSVSDILSNLVFLELLSTVVQQFSASGAGFIFEAFLAGLLRGMQVTETVAGALPIEDIRIFVDPETGAGGRAVSLKLLRADTDVSGSIKNLLYWLATKDSENKGIEYVIAVKFGDKVLAFYSITITKDNILDWIGDRFSPENLQEGLSKVSSSLIVEEEQNAEGDEEKKEKIETSNREYNLIGVVAGLKDGNPPRMRAHAIELAKGAPQELIDTFMQYAKDAGQSESAIKYKMFPKNPEDGTIDWQKAIDRRRQLLYWMRRNLSSQHILGLPDVIVPDVQSKSKLSGEKTAALTRLAHEDPKRWFKIMIEAAKESQFHIDAKYYKTKGLPDHMLQKRYGDVTLDKVYIREVATSYNEQLKEVVIPLYEALASFNNNLTSYYIEHNLVAARDAATDAGRLKTISDDLAKAQKVEK